MDILNDDGQRDNEGMDLLKQGYAKIDADQGIETDEAHAIRVQQMNKEKVDLGIADSYTKLTYAYGKINDERTIDGEPYRRRKDIKENNARKMKEDLEKHKARFPEAFSK